MQGGTNVRILDPQGMDGPLEAMTLAHGDSIPTLKLSSVKLQDLKVRRRKLPPLLSLAIVGTMMTLHPCVPASFTRPSTLTLGLHSN